MSLLPLGLVRPQAPPSAVRTPLSLDPNQGPKPPADQLNVRSRSEPFAVADRQPKPSRCSRASPHSRPQRPPAPTVSVGVYEAHVKILLSPPRAPPRRRACKYFARAKQEAPWLARTGPRGASGQPPHGQCPCQACGRPRGFLDGSTRVKSRPRRPRSGFACSAPPPNRRANPRRADPPERGTRRGPSGAGACRRNNAVFWGSINVDQQ